LEDGDNAVVLAAAGVAVADEEMAMAVVTEVLEGMRTNLYHNADKVYLLGISRVVSQWGHIGLLGVAPAVEVVMGVDVARVVEVVRVVASRWHKSLRSTHRLAQASGSARSLEGTRKTTHTRSSCSTHQ
jgi:hypothetical protein